MKIPDLLKGKNDDSFLFNDRQRAIKNHRLMQWAKAATFGLYIVAVFMLYVSDVWGIASFVEKNSNEFIALIIFSVIAFTLAYFLASSKEAVYEDIAIHRSEGYKLKPSQYAAMGLFLSSGILFEMFSTTNNQQHIANTAAEQSSMMKSIQGTDVNVAGSVALTESLQKAQVRLATCQKLLEKGKVKDCVESQANVKAVQESMTMSNQLAQTASQQAMTSKVDGMLKVREHFDKPMFQAIGKATDTDNNTGMLMVIGVLIFIFECQHIMALFAYANALRRLKQNGADWKAKQEKFWAENAEWEKTLTDEERRIMYGADKSVHTHPAPMPEGVMSKIANGADSAKQTVGEYAAKVEQGLQAAPEIIATEYARAQNAREQLYQKAADKLDSIQDDLNKASEPKDWKYINPTMEEREARSITSRSNHEQPEIVETEGFRQSPAQRAKVQELYNQQLRDNANGKTYREELRNGETVYSDSPLDMPRPAPRLSVEATVKQIHADVKASGANTPDAIRASVFNSFATMQNPAPLDDAVLDKLADKLIIRQAHAPAPARPANQKPGATGLQNPALGSAEEHYPLPIHAVPGQPEQPVTTVHAQSGQRDGNAQSGQPEQPVTTVHAQPEQPVMPELSDAAKRAEADLYPDWIGQVSGREITPGARDAKRFLSQATFNKGDKTVLSVQEMGRIWLSWQERGATDGILKPNPKYQPGNRQAKYLLAA